MNATFAVGETVVDAHGVCGVVTSTIYSKDRTILAVMVDFDRGYREFRTVDSITKLDQCDITPLIVP